MGADNSELVRVKGIGLFRLVRDAGALQPHSPEYRLSVKKSLDEKFQELRGFVGAIYNGLEAHEKASLLTSPVPILGDAVGVLSDAINFIKDPESRTIANGLLALSSAIPFVPSVAAQKVARNIKELPYIHNTEPNQLKGSARFGGDVEPAGQYITPLDNPPQDLLPNFIGGVKKFENPLVIDFGGGYTEPSNWKNVLSQHYEGKTGIDLTNALRADGYDGIVTVDPKGYLSESVDLGLGKGGKPLIGVK